MPRLVFSVKVSVACSVPPLSVILLVTAETGVAPKYASEATAKVPPLMSIKPPCACASLLVNVPAKLAGNTATPTLPPSGKTPV